MVGGERLVQWWCGAGTGGLFDFSITRWETILKLTRSKQRTKVTSLTSTIWGVEQGGGVYFNFNDDKNFLGKVHLRKFSTRIINEAKCVSKPTC